jgi:hypothetical protein
LFLCEFGIILAQLRHMPPAVGSDKTPVKHQYYIVFAPVV